MTPQQHASSAVPASAPCAVSGLAPGGRRLHAARIGNDRLAVHDH
jgi:hypothetical protein